jgi:hypothetical protein
MLRVSYPGTRSVTEGSSLTLELPVSSCVEMDVKTIHLALGLAAVLLIPAGATAKPGPGKKPAAKQQCEAERGKSNRENAHGKCAKECAAERGRTGAKAFTIAYGTNENGRNAFGRCMSAKARGPDE